MTTPQAPTTADDAGAVLLPCPFCGSKVVVLHKTQFGAFVRCRICCASSGANLDEPIPAIIAAWNRRADTQAPPAAEGVGEVVVERVAIELWHRFAPGHRVEWEYEPHKSEYIDAARAALAARGEK